MPTFLPFNGVLPVRERASQVAAVPYDVVNASEAAQLAAGNPWSFLHVSRPEIDMEDGVDVHGEAIYRASREAYDRLKNEVPLVADEAKHLYVYQLEMNGRVQTGVFGAASAEDYCNNLIRKHEKTRQDKEDDRTNQVLAVSSHTGPAFFTYRDEAAINTLIAQVLTEEPWFNFTAPDGIRHTLWRADEDSSNKLAELYAQVPLFYIADGHHRSAAAARTSKECAPKNPNHTGKEDYNYFLAAAFPASQLKILPYNRVVRTLNSYSKEEFLKALAQEFEVVPTTVKEPAAGGEFCMYLDGQWYLAKPLFAIDNLNVIERLDVSILQDHVLRPLLNIQDPRTSKEIDFIGGIRGTAELEKLVDSGAWQVAFSMYPTTVDQLMDIADAGEIMPPKSTWFEPKLRDGLVCHDF